MPALGAYADLRAAKKRLLLFTTAGCVARHRLAGRRRAGRLGAGGGGHRAVQRLLLLRRVAHRGLPARTGAPRRHRPRLGLGLELRLLRRHADAGPEPGLCDLGAGPGHDGAAVRAGDDADHRRRLRRWRRWPPSRCCRSAPCRSPAWPHAGLAESLRRLSPHLARGPPLPGLQLAAAVRGVLPGRHRGGHRAGGGLRRTGAGLQADRDHDADLPRQHRRGAGCLCLRLPGRTASATARR